MVKSGDIWRHYKGKDYRIITLSRSAHDLTWYVVYEALYENEASQIWHRELDEFLGSVNTDGKAVARFIKKEKL